MSREKLLEKIANSSARVGVVGMGYVGLPFAVEMPRYNQEALAAMEEGRRIARDPSVKGYTNMADLKKALEQE